MEIGAINSENQPIQTPNGSTSILQLDNNKNKSDTIKSSSNDNKKAELINSNKTDDKKSNEYKDDKQSSDISLTYTHLKFEIQPKTREIMVKIIDDKTGKVVMEIPPKKLMDMLVGMMTTTKGNLLNSKV